MAATLPTAVSGFAGMALVPRVTGRRHQLGPRPAAAAPMVRYSLVNWASTIAYQAPSFAMPVIVLVHVDADRNASFYVAWGVAALACYVPTAIGQALLAEGGRGGATLRSQVRLAIGVAGGLMVLGAVAATIGRDLVVTLYGSEYRAAADVLPLLVAAAIPWAATSVYLTEARVRHRSGATVAITMTLSLAILVPALVLVPERGIDGAAQAFLGGNLAAAVVAVVAHLVGRSEIDDSATVAAPESLEPDEVAVGLASLT